MDLTRRNVLIGLGATVAGSAAVFGSSAFTSVEAEQNVTIGVDPDDSALLTLVPNDSVDSVQLADSELVVDTDFLSDGENVGLNVDAAIELGNTSGTFGQGDVVAGEEAFRVENNFDNPSSIDVGFDLANLDPSGGGEFTLVLTPTDANSTKRVAANNSKTIAGLNSDAAVQVAIEIETDPSSAEVLDGRVTVSAEQS